ncbi:MAG: 4'-phosphopantetheinyl transferase superfamily protein [Bacteriovoracaceae bacterium]|nr:4'-phosphopantetheinyl transferase superfamily protein [Bacteriovoracaceae bacterium]
MKSLTIQVFQYSQITSRKESLFKILSSSELERCERFLKVDDKEKFILSRGTLRNALAEFTGKKASALNIKLTKEGKPYLEEGPFFNLAHSRDYFVLTIASSTVGVDIEYLDEKRDIQKLAPRVFHSDELTVFQKISSIEKQQMFFSYWSLKEAILKAMGDGLLYEMKKIRLEKKSKTHYFSAEGYFVQGFQFDKYYGAIAFEKELPLEISYQK